MSQEIIISKDNAIEILKPFMEYISNEIVNKDIASKYIDKFKLADKIKIDGQGNMCLFDNGEYIKLDKDKLNITKTNIDTIYKLFNINVSVEKWESKANMFTGGQGLTSSIIKDKIYCIGGVSGSKNECYDISTNTWSTKLDIPTARQGLISFSYNSKIYCIGGYGDRILNINECYDIITNTWNTKSVMPNARYYLTACIYKDKIYCIGGSNNSYILNNNECYDITTNTWSTKLDIPVARYGLTSCNYKDKIYCIGGDNGTDTLCYDISTNTWDIKAAIPTARYRLTSCIYKDKVYTIGGNNGSNQNECYDITTNTWSTKLNMITGRYFLTSSIYNNKIYVMGGANNNSNEVYNISDISYDISLPNSIQDKLDIIRTDGDGTKLLSNNGSYVGATPTFNIINDSDIDAIMKEISI